MSGNKEAGEWVGQSGETTLTIYRREYPPLLPKRIAWWGTSELKLGLHRRRGLARVPDPPQWAADSIVIFVIFVNFVSASVCCLCLTQVCLLVLEPWGRLVYALRDVRRDRDRRGIQSLPGFVCRHCEYKGRGRMPVGTELRRVAEEVARRTW